MNTVEIAEVPTKGKIITRFNLVLIKGEKLIAVATERDDNPGPSITNAAERLAQYILCREKIHPSRMLWVEHYGHEDSEDTWDSVNFTWHMGNHGWEASAPVWKRLTGPDVTALLTEDQAEEFKSVQDGSHTSVSNIVESIMESCDTDVDLPDTP